VRIILGFIILLLSVSTQSSLSLSFFIITLSIPTRISRVINVIGV